MDTSMILGLGLAGFIVLVSGQGKRQEPDSRLAKSDATEFVLRVESGAIAISPKQKSE